MKMKVSRLFAVTRFTPKRIVRSSLPCRDGVGEVFPRRGTVASPPREH